MSVCVRSDFFSPEQILDSGQCFRMTRLENGRIQVLAGARRTELEQTAAGVLFHCTGTEYETFWKNYFDLEADYGAYADKIDSRDDFLRRAAQYGRGVRILRQEPWEMIVTFLISQQNNIKRIRRCIEALCERYGAPVGGEGEEALFHAFPTSEQLARASEQELRALGVGYRSRYLTGTAAMAVQGAFSLPRLQTLSYRQAREELLRLPGVGEKVADCICLFGLHHLDAFPVDVHIRRVLEAHYPKGFPVRRYRGCRGVMQQYLFFYDYKMNGAGKSGKEKETSKN